MDAQVGAPFCVVFQIGTGSSQEGGSGLPGTSAALFALEVPGLVHYTAQAELYLQKPVSHGCVQFLPDKWSSHYLSHEYPQS